MSFSFRISSLSSFDPLPYVSLYLYLFFSLSHSFSLSLSLSLSPLPLYKFSNILILKNHSHIPPSLHIGESRYYLKNLSSGQYELLVVGKRKEHLGSLLFQFTIENNDICEPEIRLSTSQGPNSSVAINFHGECFSVTRARERVQFQCSIAGRQFTPCEANYVAV